MHIHITDNDTGRTLWTGAMCAKHCGLSTTTWRGYVRKGMPPAPAAHLDARTPLWDAGEVRTWHSQRPSQRRG